MTFPNKYLTTALVSAWFLLSTEAYAGTDEDVMESETKRSKTAPTRKDKDDVHGQLVSVKLEPLEGHSFPQLLSRETIRLNLRHINPNNGDENCLPCCISFINWVMTGDLKEAPCVSLVKPNIIIYPDSADLIDFDLADSIPNGAFEIVIRNKGYPYIDVDAPKKVVFNPSSFGDLKAHLNALPLKQGQGGAFATGLLFVEILDKDLGKVKLEKYFVGHFLNFYITQVEGGQKKILMIDPQTGETNTLDNYIKKVKNFYKDELFVWCDKSGQPVRHHMSSVKTESSSESPILMNEEGLEPRHKMVRVEEDLANTNAPADIQNDPGNDSKPDEVANLYTLILKMKGDQATKQDLNAAAKHFTDAAESTHNPELKAQFLQQAAECEARLIKLGKNAEPSRPSIKPARPPQSVVSQPSNNNTRAKHALSWRMELAEKYKIDANKYRSEMFKAKKQGDKIKLAFSALDSARKLIELKGVHATADDFDLAANIFNKAASLSTTPAEKLGYYSHAATYVCKLLELKGNQATADDFELASSIINNVGVFSSIPSEKFGHFNQAGTYVYKLLELKGDQATAHDFDLAVRIYNNAGVFSSTSIIKRRYFTQAATYVRKFLELEGNQATVGDLNNALRIFHDAGVYSTTPTDKYGFFSQAATYVRKLIELKGDHTTVSDLDLAANIFNKAGFLSTTPAERCKQFSQAVTYVCKLLELKGDKATADDYHLAAWIFNDTGETLTNVNDKQKYFDISIKHLNRAIEVSTNMAKKTKWSQRLAVLEGKMIPVKKVKPAERFIGAEQIVIVKQAPLQQ